VSATFELRFRGRCGAFALEIESASTVRRLGLFGPSGAGKSSVLEFVAGWRRPVAGRISVGGRVLFDSSAGIDLAPELRGVGYVPQDHLLLPHRDVEANLAVGQARARARGLDTAALSRRVVELLELGPLLARAPVMLSGGERQRVALARALCSGPEVLLLDEPLASLDLALRRRILPYLLKVADEFELPMLYVSHDPTEVAALCEEVVLLRDGRCGERGAPADLLRAVWRSGGTAAPVNVLRGVVRRAAEDVATVELAPGLELFVSAPTLAAGTEVVLALSADEILVARSRPEGLSARNVLAARVAGLEHSPAGVVVSANLAEHGPVLDVLLTRASTKALQLESGCELHLVVKSNSVRVLSARSHSL
jgi:molybdate transport system ATP-binding protein